MNREADDSISFIKWLFNGRCVGLNKTCWNQGTDRSHIIPKSRGSIASGWKNIVFHCPECHSEYHRMGASENNIEMLQARREKYLVMFGREDYL